MKRKLDYELKNYLKFKLSVDEMDIDVENVSVNLASENVFDEYLKLGFNGFYIRTFGNDIFVPSALGLDELQYGYAWNPKTKLKIEDWPADYCVVASQGHEVFACSKLTNKIYYLSWVCGRWCSHEVFENLIEMFYVFSIIGRIAEDAGLEFSDDFGVRRKFVDKAIVEMGLLGIGEEKSIKILLSLCWLSE